MSELITMGETMAALVPGAPGALRYVSEYRIRPAGAESNVAVGAAKLGISVSWISRVGEDEFGHYICNQTRAEGVDCSHVIYDTAHRTGIMFKETGVGETKVFYYRENSAASHMEPDDLPENLLADARILHLSGITPVLSEQCKNTVMSALERAHRHGVRVSFDPNVRWKLWGDNDYVPILKQIAYQSEIVLLGLDEAEALFGLNQPDAVFDELFGNGTAEYAAVKDGSRGAYVADKNHRYFIPPYACRPVDPIGAGDGFNAGFLSGLLKGCGTELCGKMGAICGALATQVTGDVEGYPDEVQMWRILNGEAVTYR